ncbi:MAG: GNAT family N-acetyltransferase [Sphingopyxis terrae]|nr:MAG: GNAT family N-acetyltransferase [Sphingopyxis terrae]
MHAPARPIDDIVVHSVLNDGTAVCLRTIRPDDAGLLRAGIQKLSAESRYLRFFSPAPAMPDAVIERLVDVDGHDHIAWGAICTECEGEPAIGAVHAVRHKAGAGGDEMRVGEYSIAILDAFHGQGLARMMTAALLVDCLAEGLTTLDVNILSENHAALGLIKAMGGTRKEESRGVVEYVIDVAAALEALRSDAGARGVQDVLKQLGAG